VKKKFLLWIMSTHFYHWILIRVIPFIRLSTYYTSLRGRKYQEGYSRLKKGDIILTLDRRKLTTFLVPGVMTHAALCIGRWPDSEFEVAEMTHTNYTKSFFFDICKEADRVIIMRCSDFDDNYISKLVKECLTFIRALYDTCFEFGVKALYCSELVYMSDFERRLKVDLSDLAGLGRPYISPDGLLIAKNVTCVWDSDGDLDGLSGPEIQSLLKI
jgi:hypothetical protein